MIIDAPCVWCEHLILERGAGTRCAAFPEGISRDILFGSANHRYAIPGDHGLRFLPLPDAPAWIDRRWPIKEAEVSPSD